MDENNNIITEVTESDIAGFDEAWGDTGAAEVTAAEEEVTETAETDDTDAGNQRETAAEETGEPQSAESVEPEAQDKGGNQTFTLKHLGEESTVGREEVIALAQKGMDYDRQIAEHRTFSDAVDALGGLDKLSEYVDFLKELAAEGNTDIDGVMEQSRATVLSKREGIDYNLAVQKVKLQRQERELKAREQRVNAGEQKQKETDKAAERRNADFMSFVKEHPDVDAAKIPREVWEDVAKGESLSSAYAKYEIKELREQNKQLLSRAEAAEKNAANREKAAGSQKTAGAKNTVSDPFDEGWGND